MPFQRIGSLCAAVHRRCCSALTAARGVPFRLRQKWNVQRVLGRGCRRTGGMRVHRVRRVGSTNTVYTVYLRRWAVEGVRPECRGPFHADRMELECSVGGTCPCRGNVGGTCKQGEGPRSVQLV